MPTSSCHPVRCALLLLAPLALAPSGLAQRPDPGPRWSSRISPAAGLWFHGLAVIGYTGFGELPLYAPGYGAAVAERKRTPHVATALDRSAADFQTAFARDSAFEVLHFLPLYFPGSRPDVMLDAVRAVAATEPGGAVRAGSAERFGAQAIAAALPRAEQRRPLGEFAAALGDEWRGFYAGVDSAIRREDPPLAQAGFDRAWRPVEAAIAPFLARYRLEGGLILLVPALGPDGRLFQGDPRNPVDNVLAVQLPPLAEDAVYLAVRELCYPAVRRALATPGAAPAGDAAERLSGTAAVRCGAMLLDRYLPSASPAYEALWLSMAERSGSFSEAFAIPDPLLRALEAGIDGSAK